jgi:hypothetical protein
MTDSCCWCELLQQVPAFSSLQPKSHPQSGPAGFEACLLLSVGAFNLYEIFFGVPISCQLEGTDTQSREGRPKPPKHEDYTQMTPHSSLGWSTVPKSEWGWCWVILTYQVSGSNSFLLN